MAEQKHDQETHKSQNHNKVHHDAPYWMRAHRDWRVWVGVVLMLAAMTIYLMTNDLAGWSHTQPRQSISIPAGN